MPHLSLSSLGEDANAVIQRHWDSTIRRFLRNRSANTDDRFCTVSTGEPHPFGNFASLGLEHDAESVRAAIDTLPTELPCAIVLPVDSADPEVASVLSERGFVLGEEMPIMGIDAADLRDAPVDDAYEFVRIDPSRADEWGDAFARGYQIPLKSAMIFADPLRDSAPGFVYFAATREREIVSTAVLNLADGLAGIYGISTIPEQRKRGLGAWVTAGALRAGAETGYPVGVLQASVAGAPVYERLGFRRFGSMLLYVRIPG